MSCPCIGSQAAKQSIVISLNHMISVTDFITSDSLELGAGGGLVGLAVASGCKVDAPMYITDQLEMEALMQRNIALNGLQDRVRSIILNW